MAEKHTEIEAVEVNKALESAKGFWEKTGKKLAIGLGIAAVAVAGYFAYKEYSIKPQTEKANEQIFKAQQYFAQDSFALALNGDGTNKGFKYIADTYGSTKIGNLANYYAGVSYLRMGDFANAVKYLKGFSTDVPQIQMMAYGALADAYSEQKNIDESLANYKKAANTFTKDEGNSSEFLFKAALLSEVNGKNEEALELYKELKAKFPKTEKGYQAEKYIYKLSIEKNEFSVK